MTEQIKEELRHLDFNTLGDEMKKYEKRSNKDFLMPGLPTVIRFDGNAFHTFTKGLQKPYDKDLSIVMQCTVDTLIKALSPDLAYHQSDEISLLWFHNDPSVQMQFDGRVEKWLSVYAAKCSVIFNQYLLGFLPNKHGECPVFDARISQFPHWQVAYDYFIWRQWDARKNSVSSAAHAVYNNSELMYKNTAEKIEMLHQKGVDFSKYPESFRQGTFTRKMKELVEIDDETWAKIPDKNKPESRTVERGFVVNVEGVPNLLSVPVSQGAFKLFHENQLQR